MYTSFLGIHNTHSGGVSIRTTLATVVNEDANGKSWSVSYLDSPGHPQCYDGVHAALRAADGVLLVVDVVEGLLQPSVRILEQVHGWSRL